jgi:phage terminase large subunit
MRFNEATCGPGLDALAWYHEKRDEDRGIGLGPEHDWASHGADAAGLIAIDHADQPASSTNAPLNYRRLIR